MQITVILHTCSIMGNPLYSLCYLLQTVPDCYRILGHELGASRHLVNSPLMMRTMDRKQKFEVDNQPKHKERSTSFVNVS